MQPNFKTFIFILLFPLIVIASQENNNPANVTVPLQKRDKYMTRDLHNRVRCQVTVRAARMPNVKWDQRLYQVAQNYANKCVFAHNSNRSADYAALGGSGYVGENIFAIGPTGPKIFIATAILAFASEKPNFTYTTNCGSGICGCAPGATCGHYTQIIWADSTHVACAQSDCSQTSLGGQFIVCNYAPGGNYVGVPPYTSSDKYVDTYSCIAARIIPLSYFATLNASSNQDQIGNVLDKKRKTTFWTPSSTDTSPYITIVFKQPLNVKNVRFHWEDINATPKTVQVEYSTNPDGSGAVTLPSQVLPQQKDGTVKVRKTNLRFIRIHFLENYNQPIKIYEMDATDPTFSWNWEKLS